MLLKDISLRYTKNYKDKQSYLIGIVKTETLKIVNFHCDSMIVISTITRE